ncbi:MAG TPA: helix-turn-helix domain-containing protein [Nitrospirae bacterium]|nr:helix-turn-helix domain-containing protein [Nitrospirota bacterium]
MWVTILRVSAILSVGLTIKQALDEFTLNVNANRIYSTRQATKFLGIERKGVIKLIKKSIIKAKMIDGNYRITGASILEYLSDK